MLFAREGAKVLLVDSVVDRAEETLEIIKGEGGEASVFEANVINDTKSAQVEYESFLKKFPDHELSPSVKFEIEYLGKSIEEIPALKHITS